MVLPRKVSNNIFMQLLHDSKKAKCYFHDLIPICNTPNPLNTLSRDGASNFLFSLVHFRSLTKKNPLNRLPQSLHLPLRV
jgi:hypothetical protein